MGQIKHILLVEDNDQIRRQLINLLDQTVDYNISGVSTVDVALSFVQNCSLDLIILDFERLTAHDEQFLQSLAGDKYTVSIPVIILTAEPSLINNSPQVIKFIAKPFEWDILLETIRQCLDLPNLSTKKSPAPVMKKPNVNRPH